MVVFVVRPTASSTIRLVNSLGQPPVGAHGYDARSRSANSRETSALAANDSIVGFTIAGFTEKGSEGEKVDDVVARARAVAEQAHHGQRDKAGRPYIDHPARVAALVGEDPQTQAAAWLHDVVEDTPVTVEALRTHGFPATVVAAVAALTKTPGQNLEDYYAQVKANPMALAVKMADLADNTGPARLASLDAVTRERLRAKYARARQALSDG